MAELQSPQLEMTELLQEVKEEFVKSRIRRHFGISHNLNPRQMEALDKTLTTRYRRLKCR